MPSATYTLLVDWDNDGDFSDTGEDVSARVLSLEWERGRDFASQLTGNSIAGRLRAVLLNTSGDYSSFNSGSPIFGDIAPGRQVQLQAGTGSFPYTFPIVFNDAPQWTGFLQSIEPVPDVHGRNVALLTAWGPLGFLNEKRVSLAMATSLATGDAIDDILDGAGWPAADRNIDTGQTTMARFWVDRQRTIPAIRLAEDTEGGFIWEGMDGKIEFEDRHHRLKPPHTTSQATFSDANAAARAYSRIRQEDPFKQLFNEFEAVVQLYTVGGLAVLWTLPESGASSPELAPGETRVWRAQYPNPDSGTAAFAVDAWTTPVENTDYEANTASDGSLTDRSSDLTVTTTKLANSMEIQIDNDHATDPVFITLLQARGTPVTRDDPVRVTAEDSTSQTAFGERTYPNPAQFLPDTAEGQDWANFNLSVYKDPIPIESIWVNANRSHSNLVEVLTRNIGDRITLEADNDTGLGVNEDFFIEHVKHSVDRNLHHWVRWQLSPADGYSNFWVLDVSKLGTETVLAY